MVPKVSEQCQISEARSPSSPALDNAPCHSPAPAWTGTAVSGQMALGEHPICRDVGSPLASSQAFPSGAAITLPDLEFAIWWPRPISCQPQARLLRRPAVSSDDPKATGAFFHQGYKGKGLLREVDAELPTPIISHRSGWRM